MQPSSLPPPMQPGPQPLVYKTPGAVTAFKILVGIYGACALVMALYGLARVTGWESKMELRPAEEIRPVEAADWPVMFHFFALSVTMFACVFIPAKPSSWGLGLAMLILGLPCCLAPSVIVLVFWCMPPTRLYFATHGWKTLPPPTQPPQIPPLR